MENQKNPSNNLVWAILCTVLCCLPLGVASIVYATKVDGLYNSGDYAGAQKAADNAKKYAMIGAIIGGIGIVLYGILVAVGAVGMIGAAGSAASF